MGAFVATEGQDPSGSCVGNRLQRGKQGGFCKNPSERRWWLGQRGSNKSMERRGQIQYISWRQNQNNLPMDRKWDMKGEESRMSASATARF